MKFSIITITYNSEKTLEDTFVSILRQKYRPLQYILIDGLSKDGTFNLVEKYASKFKESGIDFFYKSEKDKGISDAFNKGISYCDGDVIGIINSDDKLADNALDRIAEKYSEDINVYYGNCIIFNNESDKEYIAIPSFKKNQELLKVGMALFHPSCFVSRQTYIKYGGYDINLKFCMDRDFFLKIYKLGCKFVYVDSPLAFYREGGVNQINYEKCARENMEISIKYGMNSTEAQIRKSYFKVHDYLWKLIQKLKLERVFHKETEKN